MLQLEVFEEEPVPGKPAAAALVEPAELEEAKLAAYDQGYQAGWDDAAAAEQERASHLGAELSRNLQGLSFTYHEARSAMLAALEPLLMGITGRLLPAIARESLAPLILEVVRPLGETRLDIPVTVACHPSRREAIETALAAQTDLPLVYEPEDSLGQGQVFLRIGTQEQHIDLDAALEQITQAVTAFFATDERNEA